MSAWSVWAPGLVALALSACRSGTAPVGEAPAPASGQTALTTIAMAAAPKAAAAGEPHPSAPPTAPLGSPCAVVEDEVSRTFASLPETKEPENAVRGAFEDASRALARCPHSEALWYAASRSAELGQGAFPLELPGGEATTPLACATLAARAVPASARIRTVLARLDGTVATARGALALDPGYPPATAALADALTHAGEPGAALTALAGLAPVLASTVSGVHLARARALLARGDARGAATEAPRELSVEPAWGDGGPAGEPALYRCTARDVDEMWGLALLASGNVAEGRRHLERARTLGSAAAASALRAPR